MLCGSCGDRANDPARAGLLVTGGLGLLTAGAGLVLEGPWVALGGLLFGLAVGGIIGLPLLLASLFWRLHVATRPPPIPIALVALPEDIAATRTEEKAHEQSPRELRE